MIAIDGPSCAALELGARSMSAVCRSQSSVPLGASSAFWALVQQSSRALTGITGKDGDQNSRCRCASVSVLPWVQKSVCTLTMPHNSACSTCSGRHACKAARVTRVCRTCHRSLDGAVGDADILAHYNARRFDVSVRRIPLLVREPVLRCQPAISRPAGHSGESRGPRAPRAFSLHPRTPSCHRRHPLARAEQAAQVCDIRHRVRVRSITG